MEKQKKQIERNGKKKIKQKNGKIKIEKCKAEKKGKEK